MEGPNSVGHEHLYRLADELSTFVAKQGFALRVYESDQSVSIDDHYRVRSGLEK
jgi:hypothetical protein